MNPIALRYDVEIGRYVENASSKRLLFHHIPKTAGSTFRGLLENFYDKEQVCPAEESGELTACLQNSDSSRYRFFAGHFGYSTIKDHLSDAVWVTFLRDPVQRVVSQYYNHSNIKRIPRTWMKRISEMPEWKQYMLDIKGVSLADWLTHQNSMANSFACNRQMQAFLPDSIRLQVDDWSVYDQELVNMAKDNMSKKFVFVGIQEYFDLSIDLFALTFALNAIETKSYTTNLNKVKNVSSSYSLDQEVYALIQKKNRMDAELYEYAKEHFFQGLHVMNYRLISNNRIYLCNKYDVSPAGSQNIKEGVRYFPYEKSAIGAFRRMRSANSPVIEFYYSFSGEKKIEIDLLLPVSKRVFNNTRIRLDDHVLNIQTLSHNAITNLILVAWGLSEKVISALGTTLFQEFRKKLHRNLFSRCRLTVNVDCDKYSTHDNYHRLYIEPEKIDSKDGFNCVVHAFRIMESACS